MTTAAAWPNGTAPHPAECLHRDVQIEHNVEDRRPAARTIFHANAGRQETRLRHWGRPQTMGSVHVEAINIGPSRALAPVRSVTAVAGKGLVGDRHFGASREPGSDLTLIEAEVLEDVGLTGAQSRRQVVVRGVRLGDLIGKRFRVGEVECLGVEICEPCRHLQQLTRPGIIKDLLHRGGLNADILSGGTISVGDELSCDSTDLGQSC